VFSKVFEGFITLAGPYLINSLSLSAALINTGELERVALLFYCNTGYAIPVV